jgi:uncharacterized protein with NRDE domain
LFKLLSDRRTAAITQLPKTGIALERERALSAEFIHTPDYGTRASTLVWVRQNHVELVERSFDATGFKYEVRHKVVQRADLHAVRPATQEALT